MSVLSQPQFHDEAKAFAFLESVLWADGIVCPHCGVVGGRVYDLSDVRGSKSKKNPEGAIRHGLKKCGECRKQFTVKVGTVFEHARMPLHKMLQAVHLIVSSKKGISAHQLHRVLEVQYKSAWFLAHRIREAMRTGDLFPFGSDGGVVEVDETFLGVDPDYTAPEGKRAKGTPSMMKVLSLVERNTGRKHSVVIDKVSASTIWDVIGENIAREAFLMTDDGVSYKSLADNFAGHGVVKHRHGEYVSRFNPALHTQTVEGSFSIFKRGMRGIYQHCSKKHLHRYLAEFDFRYSNRSATGIEDRQRAVVALQGITGKRLTYARSGVGAEA